MRASDREARASLGAPRVHHRRVDSTSERAKRLAREGAPHGTIVTAAEQTAGRGRQGRAWSAPPGAGVLMSAVVRGLRPRDALMPLAAAVAVCDACEASAPVECRIKWPNDVWIERRKVAGILVEGRPQEGWAVVGVGINVSTSERDFPPELRETATSLALAARAAMRGGGAASVERVLAELLTALGSRLDEPPAGILGAWRSRDALTGEAIAWDGGEGTAAGIDDEGALLVDTAAGRVALEAGEVHLGGPPPPGRGG